MKRTIRNTITGALILLGGTVCAQGSGEMPRSRIVYEAALLDSAHRYELLKPTFFSLKSAYEYQGKEVEDLRNALRLSELQGRLHQEELDRRAQAARRIERRKLKTGLLIGTLCGILITTLIH